MYDLARVIRLSLNSCGHEYSHMVVTYLSVEYIIRQNRCTGCSPSQHALFLQHAPAVTFDFHDSASVQSNFDVMYTIMHELLDRFYAERQVTVTSADPRHIMPAVKAMLRR